MYKPNGEEPMTKKEETRRKAAIAERKRERESHTMAPEALRTAFYAALFRSSSYHSDTVEALEISR